MTWEQKQGNDVATDFNCFFNFVQHSLIPLKRYGNGKVFE